MKHDFKKRLLSVLLSLLLLLLLWELLFRSLRTPLILPSPFVVLRRLAALCRMQAFYRHVGATMGRVFLSFALGMLAGTLLGCLCGCSRLFDSFCSIAATTVRSTPVISFALLAALWLGASAVPVFVATLMTAPVMLAAMRGGAASVPRSLRDAAGSYRLTRRQRFRSLTLPAMLPFLRSGALSCFGMAWKVVAAGEVLSLPALGAGKLLYTAQLHLETADLLAVTVCLVLLSFCLEKLAAALLRRAGKQHANALRRKAARVSSCRSPQPQELPPDVPGIQLAHFCAVRSGRELYRDFSLDVAPASSTALLAPSGAGKTTLLHFVASLLQEGDGSFSGQVSCGQTAGSAISFLFQEPRLFPSCTVLENVLLPLETLMGRQEAAGRAVHFLRECGLAGRIAAFPSELSGGERRRAALARAFAFPSPLMLLDEAFQSQDISVKLSLIEAYEKLLSQSPRTVIFVTHDIREALSCCSRVILLAGSPLTVRLDELLKDDPAAASSFADRYLSPDAGRQELERRITGILLGRA